MGSIEPALVAIGVSLDVFVLALAVGMSSPKWSVRDAGQAVIAMSLPTMLVLVATHALGHHCLDSSQLAGRWLAPLALAWIGGVMLAGSVSRDDITLSRPIPRDVIPLMLMGFASSLDAGAAGLALGSRGTSLWAGLVGISVVTAGFALVGLLLGFHFRRRSSRAAELTGGTVLVGLAGSCCWS